MVNLAASLAIGLGTALVLIMNHYNNHLKQNARKLLLIGYLITKFNINRTACGKGNIVTAGGGHAAAGVDADAVISGLQAAERKSHIAGCCNHRVTAATLA